MNELQTVEKNSVQAMVDPRMMTDRINKIHKLAKSVMRNGIHFGTIPGCGDRKSLLLPGAQVLKASFKIASRYIIEDLSTPGEKTFRVSAEIFDQGNGTVLGYGVGECSSNEEKFAWRKAVCDEEFAATPENLKRIKFSQWNGKVTQTKQIRTNPADVANTVLKMATKRADIHGTINVTSASEVFTQDLEDLPEGLDMNDRATTSSKPSVSPQDISSGTPAQQKPVQDGMPTEAERASLKLISEAQGKRMFVLCKNANVKPEDVCAFCGVRSLFWLTWDPKNAKNAKKIELALSKQPEVFTPKPAPAKEPETPAVMGQEEFETELKSFLGFGYVEADLIEDLGAINIAGIKEIPADRQQEVLGMLRAREQAGA